MIRKLGTNYRAFSFTDLLPILYAVSGSANDIEIYAVFVSWVTGQALLGAVGDKNTTCTLQPAFQNTAWSIMAVSFISLLAVSAILATFFFVRRHRLRHFRLLAMEPSGMNAREVQALPTFIFKGSGDRGGTAETCAICLEDYESGEKLRLLPCHHGLHMLLPIPIFYLLFNFLALDYIAQSHEYSCISVSVFYRDSHIISCQ